MLIKIFDTDYFDPVGIRLEEIDDWSWLHDRYSHRGTDKQEIPDRVTRIIFGYENVKNPMFGRGDHPRPEYIQTCDCLIVKNKTQDEVADAINKQLLKVSNSTNLKGDNNESV